MEALRQQAGEPDAAASTESASAGALTLIPPMGRTFYQRRGKRMLDVLLGTLLFVGLLPLMVVAALAVLATSGWPIFYKAERIGLHGHRFRMLKFRTMVRHADKVLRELLRTDDALAAEYRRTLKLRKDPRRTKLGVTFRKFSIDELPQLWHVITGKMSLVGPRPYAVEEAPLLSRRREILLLTPGLTGPWQVQGRNELPVSQRIELDADYAAGLRLGRDLRYLLATANCLVRPNGL